MEGFVRGDEAVLTFWPLGRANDGSSYGALFLHRDPVSPGGRWTGGYLRPGTDIGRRPGQSNMNTIESTWTRLR